MIPATVSDRDIRDLSITFGDYLFSLWELSCLNFLPFFEILYASHSNRQPVVTAPVIQSCICNEFRCLSISVVIFNLHRSSPERHNNLQFV